MPDMNNHTIEGLSAQRDALLAIGQRMNKWVSAIYNQLSIREADELSIEFDALIATIEALPKEVEIENPECTCASEDGDGCFIHGCEICGKYKCTSDHS